MPSLLALLRGYASGQHSYQTLAEHLNAQGHRNREGEPFTKGSVEHVLANRFYEGKAVFHPGEPDEEVREGSHQIPTEVRELWLKCQEIKRHRVRNPLVSGPVQRRIYPFSGVVRCLSCHRPYHGRSAQGRDGRLIPELQHHVRRCGAQPTNVPAHAIESEFDLHILPHLKLDEEWEKAVLACLDTGQTSADESELQRLRAALQKLRDLYLWGDIDAGEYQAKKSALERQHHAIAARMTPSETPNLERAADLLNNLPVLWKHPGVTDSQRQELLREVFEGIYIEGKAITAVQPNPQYLPLFAHKMIEHSAVSPDGSTPLAPMISHSTFPRESSFGASLSEQSGWLRPARLRAVTPKGASHFPEWGAPLVLDSPTGFPFRPRPKF